MSIVTFTSRMLPPMSATWIVDVTVFGPPELIGTDCVFEKLCRIGLSVKVGARRHDA